jgi:hypothetical protein
MSYGAKSGRRPIRRPTSVSLDQLIEATSDEATAMQKFFCDLCDAEIEAHNIRKEREYTLTKNSDAEGRPIGRTIIVQVKIKQGEVCEPCAKKIVMEGHELRGTS